MPKNSRFLSLFSASKPILGMLHLKGDTPEETVERAMRELDEMGIRYNDPFTGRYFDIPPHVDFDLDPTLWWAEASSGVGGGTHSDP